MAIQSVPSQFKGQTLSDAQIAGWAQQGGFTGNDEAIAVAVAIAESSGHIDATNTNTNGSVDYGIWQINSVHADLFNQYPQWWSVENADMAHAVYAAAGNKFSPWTTYNSGAYQLYMTRAKAAVGAPDQGNVVGGPGDTRNVTVIPGVDSIASSLAAFGTGFSAVAGWVSDVHNWERVGLVLIGGALIVAALAVLGGKAVSGPLEYAAGKVLRSAAT